MREDLEKRLQEIIDDSSQLYRAEGVERLAEQLVDAQKSVVAGKEC